MAKRVLPPDRQALGLGDKLPSFLPAGLGLGKGTTGRQGGTSGVSGLASCRSVARCAFKPVSRILWEGVPRREAPASPAPGLPAGPGGPQAPASPAGGVGGEGLQVGQARGHWTRWVAALALQAPPRLARQAGPAAAPSPAFPASGVALGPYLSGMGREGRQLSGQGPTVSCAVLQGGLSSARGLLLPPRDWAGWRQPLTFLREGFAASLGWNSCLASSHVTLGKWLDHLASWSPGKPGEKIRGKEPAHRRVPPPPPLPPGRPWP